jgi:signal transduction histidine kinase
VGSSSRPPEADEGAFETGLDLGAVVHGINNPLFAIVGLAELLLAEAEPGSKTHERLCLIHESALEIRARVRELAEAARVRERERP